MTTVTGEKYTGERALFKANDMVINECVFYDGESPLKHSSNIELNSCLFRWKYPLWYSNDIVLKNSAIYENGRAGIWYTKNISVYDTIIEAPKSFRRSDGIVLDNITFSNAQETLWQCKNIKINNVNVINGDYFLMNCEDVEITNLKIVGNYILDGAKDVVIRNSKLLTKDAFWNSENVTVYDSFISGEYLGWNAKNLTLINCTIESLQGLCYVENLVMKNCRTIDTTLAFEYSSVDADIKGKIDSIYKPSSGVIKADEVGEVILEDAEDDKVKVYSKVM